MNLLEEEAYALEHEYRGAKITLGSYYDILVPIRAGPKLRVEFVVSTANWHEAVKCAYVGRPSAQKKLRPIVTHLVSNEALYAARL